jgi:hypothetical protein
MYEKKNAVKQKSNILIKRYFKMLLGLPVDSVDYLEDNFRSEVAKDGKEIERIYILRFNLFPVTFRRTSFVPCCCYSLMVCTAVRRWAYSCAKFMILWSSGQISRLQSQRSRVRVPALPDFLRSSGSGTGSTQPREDN